MTRLARPSSGGGESLPLFLLCLSLFSSAAAPGPSPVRDDDAGWPRFRGPHGSGIGASDFPTHFGPGSNLLWSVPTLPGHSSPAIRGGRIFLTGYSEGKLATFCLDQGRGELLWRRDLDPGRIEHGAQLGNPATATPAVEGGRVFVYFGAFGLAAYDLAGKELWRKPLPIPVTQHGAGTSPVVAGGLVILNSDQDTGSFLLAVDPRDGSTVWKSDRPGFRRGFATPLPWPPESPDQLVVPGTLRLVSYTLATGLERWSVRGLPNEMVSSPVGGNGRIYVAGWTSGSGVPRMPEFDKLLELGDTDKDGRLSREEAPPGPARQHFAYIDANKDGVLTRAEYDTIARIFDESRNIALAVRPDGRGDVTATHVEWRATRGLPYVPSPLYYDGRLYLVRNGGLASCLDASTGRAFYQEERLGALGDYYSSPVAAAGKICVASQQGVVVVYRAGEALEVLARNPLGEPVLATPAILDGTLFIRTEGHLHAFRGEQGVPVADPLR
ncbi:MAG TPA: pyrrolo-quinoline quinone [Verrucomicrobiales bacterium]|nr:pyrrolo-quinoline quinone [Verrucomicrobiales bacterium]